MGRLSRGQVAGLLSVLLVLGAVAFAAAVQPPATSVPEAVPSAGVYPTPTPPRPKPKPTLVPRQQDPPAPLAPSEPPGPPRPMATLAPAPYSPYDSFGRPPPGVRTYTSGPETRGTVIHVAGRKVQLPPDAYIEHSVLTVLCGEGEVCPEAPLYVLRRGSSKVAVTVRSGARYNEQIAPGEEGAFDFLREVAPRSRPASVTDAPQERQASRPGDALPPLPPPELSPWGPDGPPGPPEPRRGIEIPSRGPATRGAVIHIGGREVQLPADTYIEDSVATVMCVQGLPCPEAPYLVLRRGGSTVTLSERSGVRWAEQIAPGEEGAFDFLSEVVP